MVVPRKDEPPNHVSPSLWISPNGHGAKVLDVSSNDKNKKEKYQKKKSKKPIQIRGPNNTIGSGPTKTNPNRSAPVITHCLYDHKYNNPSGGPHIDVGKKIWSVRHTMRILWRQTYKSISCWAHIRNSIRSKLMSHLSGLGQITLFEVSPNKLLGMKNHIFSTWSIYLGSFTSDTDPVLKLVFMSRAF